MDTLIASLRALHGSDFIEAVDSFARPYSEFPDLAGDFSSFVIPSVLVPPEVIELDGLTAETGEDSHVKKDEWPVYFIRLFDNDVRSP